MFVNVKENDEFALITNGARYVVYDVVNRAKTYIPSKSEVIVCLRLKGRPLFFSGDSFMTISERKLHLFFESRK